MAEIARPPQRRRFGDPGRPLSEIGEEAILAAFAARGRARPASAGLLVGPGDDAAVIRPPAGEDLVVSQDAMVEGFDWRPSWITPYDLGRRGLMVAASDLAAMGARPLLCLATLCAAGAIPVDDVLEIHAGLDDAGASIECRLGGGDLSDTDGPMVLDVTVIGSVPPGRALRRDAARAGDVVVVTGRLGAAAAGLAILDEDIAHPDGADAWLDAFLSPQARIAEGLALREFGVTCAGDLSDGLLVDAQRTADASALSVELWRDALPAADGLAAHFGESWFDLAVAGGEDFELLVTISPELWPTVRNAWPAALQPLTEVGRVVEGLGVTFRTRAGGEALPLPTARSRHYEAGPT